MAPANAVAIITFWIVVITIVLAAVAAAVVDRVEDAAKPAPATIVAPRPTGAACTALAEIATASAPALPLPEKPSIAVLPFQNLSGDPEQDYFADGMVEEIITALSRIAGSS